MFSTVYDTIDSENVIIIMIILFMYTQKENCCRVKNVIFTYMHMYMSCLELLETGRSEI